MAQNLVNHQHTKHIEIDVHFVRDDVLCGSVDLHHISTDINIADLYTKSLAAPAFHQLLPAITFN